MSQDPILVTGVAGFIGFSLARRLLKNARSVVGVDNVNPYYDPVLKEARLAVLRQFPNFTFHRLDLADRKVTEGLFSDGEFGPVVHLAAQAGVRYSLQNPHAYIDSNLAGFLNVLEGCRYRKTVHLVYASSSSVYGANATYVFGTRQCRPSNQSICGNQKGERGDGPRLQSPLSNPRHRSAVLHGVRSVGTTRLAMYIFAKAISEGQLIKLFNYGRIRRDFTYVDDVVEAVGV